ncbi:MAG: lysophospholipid acyltransferase family protein [Actinomycetota bacterium]|nr:1-acyl-sn-glycerol-3-phosphate acyltransferase [Actinomycetota bacterium]
MLTYRIVKNLLVAFDKIFFRWRFDGLENIPGSGPVIVAGNHISYFDPLCQGYMVVKAKRMPRFFAKSELWKNPLLKFVLTHARQIPVERGTGETGPVEKAIDALGEGNVVMIYPEATITTNTDLTPMQGKTGVARVALTSGAPVVPVAVWGSHWVKPKHRKTKQKFGRLILVKAGVPLVFDESLRARANEPEVLRDVTDRVMAELDRLVRELHKVYPEGAAVPELRETL